MRAWLADAVLLAHFGIAAFIALGVALIWIGIALGWHWVGNLWFRAVHLAAIAFVALQALAGMVCPLTLWEDALRQTVGEQPAFIARWIRRLLYYELPEWVFTAVYAAAALATALAWWISPPRRTRLPRRRAR